VFLNETFDSTNDLTKEQYYMTKHNVQKLLCDTCQNNYFKDITSENWTTDDFFKGKINQAPWVQAEYGNRSENVEFKNGKAIIKIPGGNPYQKTKTWGEFVFGPSFKYGTLTINAKMCRQRNPSGTPNGIVHNIWLYQRDIYKATPIPTNPFKNYVNSSGLQPYEIDYEFWTSIKESQAWDSAVLINASIVDYMRNPNTQIQPGQEKQINGFTMDRLNQRQLNIPTAPKYPQWFNKYHEYKIIWTPQKITFQIDKETVGIITPQEAAIPNVYMYLWIGSPIYQDGTYYSQPQIPFLETAKKCEIKSIIID
jgi:beta-glucanase (GH16 family)